MTEQSHNGKDGQVEVGNVKFLGEQDGAPERELKQKLAQLFRQSSGIHRAYLARVRYEGVQEAVALCIYADVEKFKEVTESAGHIFSELFGPQEYLDIVYLDTKDDAEVSKSCAAFFSR